MNTFRAGAMIGFGWKTFKERPWFFIGVTALIIIASGIAGSIASTLDNDLKGIGMLINIVLSTFISMGAASLFLKAHESPDTVESAELWHPQPFWKYLAATLLVGLTTVVGLVLLIVPGVILLLMFFFSAYIVIDRGLGPLEAMRESNRITRGHKWTLFLLFLAMIGVNILGLICFVVGLLISIPVTSLALVHAYRTLEHAASELTPVSA